MMINVKINAIVSLLLLLVIGQYGYTTDSATVVGDVVKSAESKITGSTSNIKTMQILLISRLAPGVKVEQTYPYAKGEADLAWKYYTSGRYRQMYGRQDTAGVVVFMESESMEDAKKAVEEMPVVKNKLVQYDLIPVEYFMPFSFLFNTGTSVGDNINPTPAATTATRPFLLISHLAKGVKMEETFPYGKDEAEWAWKYYSTGLYRQLYMRTDPAGGVAIIMESKNLDEAKQAVAKMPLVRNKLVEYDLIPIGHFSPLTFLFKP